MKTPTWLIIIFFGIFTLLSIGIAILNDDTSWQSIGLIWIIVAVVVSFYFGVNAYRKKKGIE